MSGLIEYISQKILDAKLTNKPFKFFEIQDFVPDEYYKSFIFTLPKLALYKPLRHKGTLKNGNPTRFELSLSFEKGAFDLNSVFPGSEAAAEVIEALCSERFKSLLLDKFDSTLEVTPYPHLYKDLAGFNLLPHTDIVEKAITFGWYLPENERYRESGLKLFTRTSSSFKEFKKIHYTPNTAFAFLRSDNSWHGATHHPSMPYERNSLFVTFYRKSHYKNGALLVNDPNVNRKEIRIYEH